MPDRTCSVDGCERPVKARGWCSKHYLRWRVHGDTADPAPRRIGDYCSEPDCDRESYARGFCRLHYLRWYRRQRENDIIRRTNPGASCSVDDCERLNFARGLCGLHYKRWMYYQSLDLPATMRESAPIGTSWCSKCRQYKPVDDFHSGGNWCRRCCSRERKRRYREDSNLRQAAYARARLRKARKRGVSRAEPYTASEIAHRDGWRCQLCGKRIGRTLKWPHSRSLSIDHIIPISKGGDDVRANVQAAHLCCNVAKSSGGTDQLRLIG